MDISIVLLILAGLGAVLLVVAGFVGFIFATIEALTRGE